jgi:hypothetical protein
MTSSNDALTLLRKWKKTSARLTVTCFFRLKSKERAAALSSTMKGTVLVAEDPGIVVISGEGCSVDFDLRECRLIREAPPESIKGDGTPDDLVDLEAILRLDFASGESCVILAYRPVN